ncbi:hypothetical protein WR30_30330 [Burkholderia contaminans FFH2055]|uniref:hypothetical protein n=1 Tax=Burkholderia TaxID=32008 RepID=UPI0006252703|nr:MULTISPECIES: hypothetical protein [Burkholderia]AOL08129.1 hypothetical protein WI95_17225 [Burkholderia contaminans]ELK6462942.1 hypothetical protein [Burkholderia contaminans]KKL31647.1 hypothetical protein WR30_30330 [Burkholderia contaminans FFH2055]MEB4631545.1 hypothetical protein [Burkholderia contaminans]MEB4637130.1 hypothetical protein [Burkholderia contaminans]
MKRLLPSASLAAAIACALALSACAAQSTAPAAASAPAEAAAPPASPASPMPGSDRDSHGCIPSAGYSWCEQTQQCERPWELAKQKGFANSALAYEQFCRNNFAK